MIDPWVVVTIVLGVVVICNTLLLVGALRNIGSLEYRMRLAGFDDLGPKAGEIRESGPPDESHLPVIRGEPLQGPASSVARVAQAPRHTLLVFLSSSCPSCHRVVESVQRLADELAGQLLTIVVMKSDIESALRFLSVFDVRLPVLHEGNLVWADKDPILFVPYWVLYAPDGHLLRHGPIEQPDGMRLLAGLVRKEVSSPRTTRANEEANSRTVEASHRPT